MKEAINYAGPTIKIVDSPVPKPNDDQVMIKVIVSGSNPKDWKMPEWAALSGDVDDDNGMSGTLQRAGKGVNQGDDIAGIVQAVGANVVEFKPGDRVAAFHEMCMPGGSYAEYAIAWSHTTFHLPKHTSFEEAATIPLATLTAAVSLYPNHRLPFPWVPAQERIPLIIYGASTAVGSFAIKLACKSNIHPIIAVAGKGSHYVETLIDRRRGDAIVDYRGGLKATVEGITSSLQQAGHSTVHHALDCVAIKRSTEVLRKCVAPGGLIDVVEAEANMDVSPARAMPISVGSVHGMAGFENNERLGFVMCRYFTRALMLREFSGHPYEVRPGGLAGVQQALMDLKEGKASATKYIFRIADTPGIS
ncbi:alcohol dehydrogenase [Blastomyces gilchristii SLH14081]|uniref:Alcohol dehydrogenase n=1 Tax=Blastomyces gilchristii (strain SLH14081) TaxID=559298 RepID=A0A179UHT1_BLAGS|nr:alcohol dehydrogenase [Blastomyces gilchristii SLH14081]OAT07606.1 alcohol dehydrogenase [Blastomyces gilchristii SLH14081]